MVVPFGQMIRSGSISNFVPLSTSLSANSAAVISIILICFHNGTLLEFNSQSNKVISSDKSSLCMLNNIAPVKNKRH